MIKLSNFGSFSSTRLSNALHDLNPKEFLKRKVNEKE